MMRQYIFFLLLILLYVPTIQGQRITITPKWTAQAQFTGYYVADKMGFYKEEGLDVRIIHPAISESSFSVLQSGKSQVAVMNLSFALTARASGAKIINIMQTSQENSLMLVSRHPLNNIASLKQKDIAVWNHLSQNLLDRISARYQLNCKWIRFNSGVNLFLAGAVDICLVGSYNEYLQLAEYGLRPDDTYLLHFSNYGYDLPEDGLYVTDEFYQAHPDIISKLVRASIRGWEWANEHKEKALDIVMDIVHENNIGTNRYHQRKMMEEILRLQVDKSCNKRTYLLSPEDFESASDILLNRLERENIHYTDFVK
ncbi:ABC transporter substrate-binding protein [Parabacteroides gordonii]|uniref:ABC transporter substrate-binding protein n=1 Tax=Parabacteroides gordonii TaxID=574930 RepID=UPI0026F2EDD3|nr:ABC transporter substrate-binding protein [Parabacteroides gordonii]